MVSSLFMYLSIFYYLLSLSCAENRSSGRTGQCGLAKEKAGTCSLIIAPLYIFLSVESNEHKGDISFIMKDPLEFRFTMFLSCYRFNCKKLTYGYNAQ